MMKSNGQPSVVAMLPPELWCNILQYANPLQTRSICRQWYHLSQSNVVKKYRRAIIQNRNVSLQVPRFQWIQDTFQLTREEATTGNNSTFRWAAEEGQLPLLQWLHDTYQITRDEATTWNNYAFLWASQGGHLPVLQWLHATYQITREEATTWDNSVFRWASKGCHLHVLQWLHDTYGITE